jgi:hypothetical protein
MTDFLEDFKTYLPKYLSTDAQKNLFQELAQFPHNIDARLYTMKLREERTVFQGDGLASLWVADLPSEKIGKSRVMVLSNTCDICPENKRLLGTRTLYCPIISFAKYEQLVREVKEVSDPAGHLDAVRKQQTSSMFFLPKNERLGEEAIALLDRINNCDTQAISLDELVAHRLFTLSDYGFYMFLFKLSVHLTRLREGVQRN